MKNSLEIFPEVTKSYPHFMGILNVTPDSFSDGGQYYQPCQAIAHFKKLINDGATSIDIGGMSTGPGRSLIGIEAEKKRVVDFLKALKNEGLGDKISLSIDTFRAEVAEAAHAVSGISIVNDISGMRYDPEMPAFVAQHGLSVVLMYSKESGTHPLVTDNQSSSGDIIEKIRVFFDSRIEFALQNNISESKIILDPGMGAFLGSDSDISWDLLRRIDELLLRYRNFKFLVGISRKGFLNNDILDRDMTSKLLELQLIANGVHIIRTHDIETLKKMHHAIQKSFK